jgi:CPA1 family monovalent cation:H+ antiporter
MKRRLALINKRISRLQARFDKLNQHDRQELTRSIAYRDRLLDIQKQGGFSALQAQFETGRATVFGELAAITEPAISDALLAAETADDDPRYVIALRDVAAQERDRLRDQQNTSKADQALLLEALQVELSYVQTGRQKGEFSPALLKQLYDEVTAAQGLVLAADNEE